MRNSRSHPGPRPISEGIYGHRENNLRLGAPAKNILATSNRSNVPSDQAFRTRSQSHENVPLVARQPTGAPRSTEVIKSVDETSI